MLHRGASPTWSPLSSFNDDRIEIRKTDCFGNTRLVPHVPSSSGLESVIIIIVINAVQHQHAEWCVMGNPLSSVFLHMAHAPYLRTAALPKLSARRLQRTQWM